MRLLANMQRNTNSHCSISQGDVELGAHSLASSFTLLFGHD